jgi:hypothetical protein
MCVSSVAGGFIAIAGAGLLAAESVDSWLHNIQPCPQDTFDPVSADCSTSIAGNATERIGITTDLLLRPKSEPISDRIGMTVASFFCYHEKGSGWTKGVATIVIRILLVDDEPAVRQVHIARTDLRPCPQGFQPR